MIKFAVFSCGHIRPFLAYDIPQFSYGNCAYCDLPKDYPYESRIYVVRANWENGKL